jgi:hypothetical protein
MAIQISYTDEQDTVFAEAYLKVMQVPSGLAKQEGVFVAHIYKSRAASKNGKRPIGHVSFDFRPEAQLDESGAVLVPAFADYFGPQVYKDDKTSPWKQGYFFLKTLAQFSAGLDVLE